MVCFVLCISAKRELLQHDGNLADVDPEIASLISKEKKRQVLQSVSLICVQKVLLSQYMPWSP